MAEYKNTDFDRPGGYAMPKGATQVQRRASEALREADIRLYGDSIPPHDPIASKRAPEPDLHASDPDTRIYIGDCRDVLANLAEKGEVDLIFADPALQLGRAIRRVGGRHAAGRV